MDQNEKKVERAYVIKHYNDGSIEATDAAIEGTQAMNISEIKKDMFSTTYELLINDIEAAAYRGAYTFYRAMENAAQQAAASVAPVENTTEQQ